ncbi:unnamed protein product, partial [Urochloa humidicola]
FFQKALGAARRTLSPHSPPPHASAALPPLRRRRFPFPSPSSLLPVAAPPCSLPSGAGLGSVAPRGPRSVQSGRGAGASAVVGSGVRPAAGCAGPPKLEIALGVALVLLHNRRPPVSFRPRLLAREPRLSPGRPLLHGIRRRRGGSPSRRGPPRLCASRPGKRQRAVVAVVQASMAAAAIVSASCALPHRPRLHPPRLPDHGASRSTSTVFSESGATFLLSSVRIYY